LLAVGVMRGRLNDALLVLSQDFDWHSPLQQPMAGGKAVRQTPI
jgi:hypothetical protein